MYGLRRQSCPVTIANDSQLELGVNFLSRNQFGYGDVFGAKLVHFNNEIENEGSRGQSQCACVWQTRRY